MGTGRKKSVWLSFLGGAAIGAAGATAGLLLARSGLRLEPVRAALDALSAWDLLVLPVIALLVIAVHEAGHLAGGMSRGMRFLLYVVGPFGWFGSAQGVHFRWCFNLGTLGGVAATMPDPRQPLAPQMMPVVLGGPLASLLLAAAGLALASVLDARPAAYALLTGGFSAAIFVMTALPFRAGGFMSDGMQWLVYRRGGVGLEKRARVTALMGMSMAGTRPRDLDEATLRLAQRQADGSEVLCDMGAWMYGYAHALDRGDPEGAGAWLQRMAEALPEYPDGFRQGIAIELALFEALYRRRHAQALEWRRQARGGIVDASRRHLADAAIAALEGDVPAATRALDAATRKQGQAMDAGFARLGADQAAMLRDRLAAAPVAVDAAA
jgi:hypothetical protein